ncbi:hypothetical protein GCM10011376_01720 [Nocardioides flavus (ex Wang et al. 2016)]|uniref:Uncharacterized protein n=1 Tax=Nocardioides flavus (ex Wang et al. 2016) TaxID=2058780 RepID=A0ABQ3HFW9_9ACTN|nr:hypothetical protein [Nocardioides flavus (ex Wang et al. 2016)]GHE15102.1 hypothetical protein GCM10011376_01720 [Nocardioides flavus (ex Wang et al. 2016)]
MDPVAQSFQSVFDARFDRCVTEALAGAEWQEEAIDAAAVAMVEVATALAAGEPSPWDLLDQRSRELAAVRRATRPGSRFLDEHLAPAHDAVRRPLGLFADTVEGLDLDPGDTFTTPDLAVPVRDGLRDAIAGLAAPDGERRRRWWSPRR